MPHTRTSAHAARLLAAMTLVAATATAQTVWDGNGDANASGNWNVGDNWSTNLVPSAVAVQLNNVTSGTRTVTYNSAEATINGLTLSQSTAGATNRLVIDAQTLTNTGSTTLTQTGGTIVMDILNGGAYRVNATGSRTITSSITLTLGSSADATSGSFTVGPDTSTSSDVFTFNNTGAVTLNNTSQLGYRSSTGAAAASTLTFNNNVGGTLNLAGATTTGIRMGVLDHNANPAIPVLSNASGATVNVTRVASESSGVGLSAWGNFDGGNQRSGARVDNSGAFNIAENAQFTVQGRRNRTDSNTTRFNNLGGSNLVLGNSSSTTAAGTLALQISDAGGTGTNANAGMFFTNDGTATLYGASAIRVGTGSVAAADGGSITVQNNATGVINLHDTSSIGTTGRNTLLTNAGTITKFSAGTASILSNTSGTNTNTGLIHVKDGALSFSSALNSTNGDLRFDLGAADITSARLVAPSLTLGGDSTLQFVFSTAALGESRSWNLWDATLADGSSISAVTLSGAGFSGSYSSSLFTNNGYDFSLDLSSGLLTATQVIPEPSAFAALAGLGALGFAASRRRRR